MNAKLWVLTFLALDVACGIGPPASLAAGDAGGDVGTRTDGATEAGTVDAASADRAAPDGSATTGSGACPASGDPAACDDGTGSAGTMTACPLGADPTATASYHLRVSGSKFATSGACLYVTSSRCSTIAGDVLQFEGSGGTGLADQYDTTLRAAPYCFRLLDVAWDSNWEDDGMTTGGPAGMGGDVLAASQKPQVLIAWVHSQLRTAASTPFCARGSSGGSSELLYQLMHDGGEALLDHVQITSATPFARIDEGCDPASPQEGTSVVCSALPATTEPEYGMAAPLVQTCTHDPHCDVAGHTLAASERASLRAMSLVPSGFAAMTLHRTSLSAYMCSSMPNATQGQAVDVFGADADLAAQGMGPYTGLISLDLESKFYACAAGTTCAPHVVCGADCSGEGYGGSAADRTELFDDLQANCVLRH